MVSNRTAVLQEIDRKHHMHPFTDTKALNERGVRIFSRGEGVYLWDTEGRQVIDGMAGLWCVNVGYGREDLVKVAADQMRELAYYNTFFQSTTPPATELTEILCSLAPPGMSHVFLVNSGSEANDSIVKMVRYYWNTMGRPTKKTIVSRDYAYHGSTLAAASLCGLKNMHPQADLPLPGFVHIEAPYWYRYGGDLSPADFGLKAARALEAKILELGADNVGAFIGEPVFGGGGVLTPPETYWPEIQRICRKYDVLLIADEVICGFGRTGSWFGSQTYGIQPDFMPVAKGLSSGYLPIAGVLVHDRVAEVLIQKGGEFAHGFTYSGHPVSAAVATANLKILRDEGIIDRVSREIGPYFQARLREFADHPLVGEVRGVGLLGAIELVEDKGARKPYDAGRNVGMTCRNHCYDNGLIMRACFDSMVLSPPLIISKAQVDEVMARARRALDLTARDLGR